MRLIKNAIQTPDGTVLESRHIHDYVVYVDKITDEQYMVDGGLYYTRTNVNKVPAKPLYVYLEDDHEVVREAVTWGTRGKDGKSPIKIVKLSEMSTDHIQACLDTQSSMHPHYREAFHNELDYRLSGDTND